MHNEEKQNIDIILEAFAWLKNHGYTDANKLLNAFNLEFETSFQFAEDKNGNFVIEN